RSPIFVAECYLGLDFGTSGARACLIDSVGGIVHEGRFVYPDSDGQQPADWRTALFDLLDGVPAEARSCLAAVAIDATSGTVLLVDAKGQPLGPALLYADTGAAREARTIGALAGELHFVASAGSGLSKLLRLLNQHGNERACHACHQADWLTGLLSGRFGTSDYHNALKTGCDPEMLIWPNWMQALPIRPLLPELVAPGASLGRLSAEVARRFTLNPACVVRAGTTDSIAAFMAAGVDQPGEAVTSLGSTLVLKLLSETRADAPEYGVYSHRYGRLWLAGGASNAGAAVFSQYFSDRQLTKLSQQINAEHDSGLDYYPLPNPGERFPVNDPQLLPRLEPRPADDRAFLHGLLESLARIEALGYRRLMELGASRLERVLTAGGGAKNETWRRIRQRALGVPVGTSEHTEAAYGTAMLARLGSEMLPG
ncbi:MAG TPA: FGGY-family carbohydrate kinase, partial [Thiobacillaceae bacterium]|nr:FGGY-family carbohydrate kinase [Thiobacillaceae bacterium]